MLTHLVLITLALIIVAVALAGDPPKAPVVMAQITALRTCQSQLGVPRAKAPEYKNLHSNGYWRWQLDRWTKRHQACLAKLHRRAYEWNWRLWLPRNWQLLGACETGYGRIPGNWFHHNSDYVSAFGIQRDDGPRGRGDYNDDARRAGMPLWNDEHPPTPWQQWQTALSHQRAFGDGWDCPGP